MNAIYAGSARALAQLAALAGDTAVASRYEERFQRIRAQWRQTFLSEGRILDSDSAPGIASFHYLDYVHPVARTAFTLRFRVTFPSSATRTLRICAWSPVEVILNNREVHRLEKHGTWHDPALNMPLDIVVTGDALDITLKVEASHIDQEVFVACSEAFAATDATVDATPTRLRPYFPPAATQVSAAYAACFGMLDPDEAGAMLRSALPPRYFGNYIRHTTPLFVEITDDPALLAGAVLPCNTPWSLFYFSRALAQHGMLAEARDFIRFIYFKLLENEPTSFWEEWRDGSSLCHAWATAPLWFLFAEEQELRGHSPTIP